MTSHPRATPDGFDAPVQPRERAETGVMERLAHDLRGPLSPLQTAAYLLRRDDIGAQRHAELLDIIDRQTSRLGGMIQEVSDWVRAQQSRLVGRRELLSVPMLVELGCAELASLGGSIDLPEELDEVHVLGDAQLLVQMLSTLVAYARSAAGPGGVGVGASMNKGMVAVRITMNEAAPRDAVLQTLFTAPQHPPFDDGLGLRLLVARSVVEEHGGRLAATTGAGGWEILIELPPAP